MSEERNEEKKKVHVEGGQTFSEEIEVAGNELVDRVKELVEEGNVRRLIIRNAEGRVLMEIPLTAGVAVGSVVTLWNPLVAAVGGLAAFLMKVKIEIVREVKDEDKKKTDEDDPASRLKK